MVCSRAGGSKTVASQSSRAGRTCRSAGRRSVGVSRCWPVRTQWGICSGSRAARASTGLACGVADPAVHQTAQHIGSADPAAVTGFAFGTAPARVASMIVLDRGRPCGHPEVAGVGLGVSDEDAGTLSTELQREASQLLADGRPRVPPSAPSPTRQVPNRACGGHDDGEATRRAEDQARHTVAGHGPTAGWPTPRIACGASGRSHNFQKRHAYGGGLLA
jgi:hypothetical protein